MATPDFKTATKEQMVQAWSDSVRRRQAAVDHFEREVTTAREELAYAQRRLAFYQGEEPTEAEQMLHDLLAPKSAEEATARRAQRDRDEAEVLTRIVRKHHEGYVAGLTTDDLRVLVSVAHRLVKNSEPAKPAPCPECGGVESHTFESCSVWQRMAKVSYL